MEDLSTWKVKELKDKLRELGLNVSGKNKGELIQRIRASKIQVSPKRILSGFPPELNFEILLNLDDSSLANAGKTSKESAKICKDDLFWKKRIERIYDINLGTYTGGKGKHKKIYKMLNESEETSYTDFLIYVSELGYLPLVEYSLPAVLNIEDKLSALFEATGNGHLSVVKYFKDNTDIITEKEGSYAIEVAAQGGQLRIVKYLMEELNMNSGSALADASMEGHLDVVRYLVEEQDADIHYENDKALGYALISDITPLPTIEYLVKHGARFTSRYFGMDALKKTLRKLGLSDKGNKEVLIKRIQRLIKVQS